MHDQVPTYFCYIIIILLYISYYEICPKLIDLPKLHISR